MGDLSKLVDEGLLSLDFDINYSAKVNMITRSGEDLSSPYFFLLSLKCVMTLNI